MRFAFYTHSLVSDWNHGNAHFLRGVMRDLVRRGHVATALEPADAWSRCNLVETVGPAAVERFMADFPELVSRRYDVHFDHETALADADALPDYRKAVRALIRGLKA
jgi:spore maturation protein CgeB